MTPAVLCALLAMAALGLAWYWRPRHPVSPATWILLGVYGVLGAGVLWLDLGDPAGPLPAQLQFWKPTLLYGVMAGLLIYAPLRGWGYPAKAVIGVYFVFSDREWRWINLGLAGLCSFLGIVNLVVAYGYTPDEWNGFRYSCMMNLLALLLLRMAFVWMDLVVRIGVRLFGRSNAQPVGLAPPVRRDIPANSAAPPTVRTKHP